MANPFNLSVNELEKKALQVRIDLIKALGNAGSGHTGGPLGFADIATAIYFYGASIDPANPKWQDRDRVIFSAGHYSPLIYSTLAHAGYFSVEHFLKDYRQYNGNLDGHPNMHVPGIENASGPLGQGTSQAAGAAAVAKLDKKDLKVWLCMSDGEQQEGQTQEALMWIGAQKLDNVIAFIDYNNIQIDGDVKDILPEPWIPKNYENYGFSTRTIDGNNMEEIVEAIDWAKKVTGKPVLICAKTIPGKGVSFMEGKYEWHGKPPKGEEVQKALDDLFAWGKKLGVVYV